MSVKRSQRKLDKLKQVKTPKGSLYVALKLKLRYKGALKAATWTPLLVVMLSSC